MVSWPTQPYVKSVSVQFSPKYAVLTSLQFNYTANSTTPTSLTPFTFSVDPGLPVRAHAWDAASSAIFCYSNGIFIGSLDGTTLVTGARLQIGECGFDEDRGILFAVDISSNAIVGFNMTALLAGDSGDTTIGAPFSLAQCVPNGSPVRRLVIGGNTLAVACTTSVGYVDLSGAPSSWTFQTTPAFGPQSVYDMLPVPDSDRWYFPTSTGIEYWRFGTNGPSPRLAASSIASTTSSLDSETFFINPSSATMYWLGEPDSSVTLNQLGSSDSAFASTPPTISTLDVPFPDGLSSPTVEFTAIDSELNRAFVVFLSTSRTRGNFTITSVGFGQCNTAATSCETCISGGDLECGWCPSSDGMTGNCGTAADCSGARWFQDHCPALTSAVSLDPLVTGLPFVIEIDANPFLGANASCFLRSTSTSQVVPIPVIAAAEPLCGISSSTDPTLRTLAGEYLLEVLIDGTLSLPSPVPVSFLNCSSLSTCKSCTSQSSSCDWCVYDGACVNYATDCSRSGPSSQRPQVPAFCPVQGPAAPNSTILPTPPNTIVSISATSLVAPPTGAGSIYTCSFSLPSLTSPIVTPGSYATSGVTCNVPTPPGNAIGAGSVTLQLNGHRFADNSNGYTFYDCTSPLLQTCNLCLAASNQACGWNSATGSCGIASNCTSGNDCRSVCPSLTSANQTSFHVTDDIGTVVAVTSPYLTAASGSWVCDFGFATTAATRVSETELRCAAPTFTNMAYFTSTQTSYPTNLTILFANKAYAPALPVNWYTCSGTSCANCLNSGTAPKCRWDFEQFTCGNAATLTTGVAQCPLVQNMSDTSGHIAGNLELTITPATTPSATLEYRCAWTDFSLPSVPTQTANATLVAGEWTCLTPDILTVIGSTPSSPVRAMFWIEAQTASAGWKSYTAMPVTFTFYNCLSASNCSVCLASSQCVWGSYKTCGPVSAPPSGDIISGHCPHLLSITPDLIPVTQDVTVTVTAQYMPASADWTTYSCLWTLSSGSLIRSAVTKVNSTAFTCPFKRTYRDLDFDTLTFSLVNGYNSVADNRLDFEVYNCPEATDCAECTQIHPLCGWCNQMGACTAQITCLNNAATNSWTTTSCPYVESMTPPYAAIGSASSQHVTFTGSFSSQLDIFCLFTFPSGATHNETANVTQSGTEVVCVLPPINETTTVSIQIGHLVQDTSGSKKRSDRVSHLYSDPAFPRSVKKAIAAATFVRLVPEVYSFDFFSCQTDDNGTEADSCISCVSNSSRDSRCGWCAYDGTCGDSYACDSRYPTFATTAATCPSISAVTPTTGPLAGGTVVTIRGSVFFNGTNGTSCMFGNQVVPATVTDSRTLTCKAPAASLVGISKNGRSTSLTVVWNGRVLTESSGYSFTYRNADTATKIIVGVVVGVSLLLILILVIIFVVFYKRIKEAHYRRRFLKLQEPDYATIAVTQASGIGLIVTPSDLKSLTTFVRVLEADTTYQIAHALGSSVTTSQSDNLAKSLVFFYQSRGRALDLLLSFVAAEIRASEHEGTLFRASSFACKLFTQYARYNALKYLWLTLGYYVNQLAEFARIERSDDRDSILGPGNMEIDPQRFADDEDGEVGLPSQFDIRQNQYELLTRTSKILKAIFASSNYMSPELRQFCASVINQVGAKFTDNNANYKAVGGFVFLRLLCPAIVAPHVYGLLPENPNETSQRYFILIAKTLQNLANETLPGTNEEFMEPINEFITKNISSLHAWIDSLCANPNDSDATKELSVPDSTINASIAYMQNILVEEWELVSKKLPDDIIADLERTVELGPKGKKPQNKNSKADPPRRGGR